MTSIHRDELMDKQIWCIPQSPGGDPWVMQDNYRFDYEERNFWTKLDPLQQIYETALARMVSPWAVLAHCAARALTLVRPNATLPPIIGGKGSLNWFAAIASKSGGGKGSAAKVARELIPGPVRERNLGSGEGLRDAYHKPAVRSGSKVIEPPERHEAVMFNADEIDQLAALGARNGSTLMAMLRAGFSGETIGFSYVKNNLHLDEHSYRMTLVLSTQPARAGVLLNDHGGGTPQRFMWFPGTDARITAEAATIYKITPLTLPKPSEWQYPRELTIPDEAHWMIVRNRAKAARGEGGDALDGHALFCREKFAYALALLDGRVKMTADDWQLSGIAAEMSTLTRDWVARELATASEDEARERGRVQGVAGAAADEEKAHQTVQRSQRIARWVLTKLNAEPMTKRELTLSITSRDRLWLAPALESLADQGLITFDKDANKWAVRP